MQDAETWPAAGLVNQPLPMDIYSQVTLTHRCLVALAELKQDKAAFLAQQLVLEKQCQQNALFLKVIENVISRLETRMLHCS